MAQIVVRTPDGNERAVELTERPVTFGRSEESDVVLSEQKASRRHCTFRPARRDAGGAGGWRVVDEGSSNGTWLGGKCVLSARLQSGDQVEIGETVLTYFAAPEERTSPEPVVRRAPRKAPVPWGALAAAVVFAVAAWFGAGALRGDLAGREAAGWKRFALAEVARAERAGDEAGYRTRLAALDEELQGREFATEALTIVRGTAARGLPTRETTAAVPEWRRGLDALDATRARMTAAERRSRLRELLSRNLGDPAAVAAFADALRRDEASALERDAAAAAQHLLDGTRAFDEGQWGRALDAWTAWSLAATAAPREEERAVAARMAEARARAKEDAQAVLAAHAAQVEEGRVAAATSLVDAALPRLRGTGWDAWLTARTHRPADDAGGGPAVPGTAAKVDARALARERMLSVLRSSEDFVRRRRFADAGVLLREAAATIDDPPLREELESRATDLAAEAELLAFVLGQVQADPKPFGAVPAEKGTVRVEGATPPGSGDGGANGGALLVGDGKGGAPRSVPVSDAPGAMLAALVEKAKLEPAQWVAAALLANDLREEAAYTAWMRRALGDASLQAPASAVHARVRAEKLPEGGYVPHPKDPKAIVTYEEHLRLVNAGKIAALTADLAKLVEKIDASKQAKSIERVAEVYAKLEAARKHALELIFDEKTYFYPYKQRMREYVPVQRDVDERVKAVRELWEDRTSAKVKSDAALDKLIQQAKDLKLEIEYLGGDVESLAARVDRLELYLGRELTVQTYFEDALELRLHEYNAAILEHNAKLKGDVDEPEREQVRITNEYRRMMGHRRMLRLHEKLVLAARGHSDDMARIGFFDHMSPVEGKKTPWDRMTLAGYPNSPCSENIHAGAGDPQTAHDGWAHSSGHHRNILMKDWSEMGTGKSGSFWTQNFGFAVEDDGVGGPGPGAAPGPEPR